MGVACVMHEWASTESTFISPRERCVFRAITNVHSRT